VRRLLLVTGAIVLVDTLFYAALTPLLPHYVDEFDLSKSGAGLLAAMYAIGALAAGIPAGLATSWLGVKRTVLIGLSGMVVTTALFGFADSVWMLDLARFLQGCASSCSWTAALAWLVADAPADVRGRLIGSAMGAALFGALLGPVVGTIGSFAGIAVTFTTLAFIGVAIAAWAWATPSLHEPKRQPLILLVRALRNRRVLAGIWFVTLPALCFGIINVLAPLRLHALGLGAAGIGATWLVTAGLEAAAGPIVGHASDKRGRFGPLRAGLVATAITMLALAVLDVHWWTLVPCIVVTGVAVGIFWAPAMSLLSDEAERTGLDYAFSFTLVNMAWAPAQIGGAAGGAAIAELTSDAVPYLTVSVLCVLTLALLWRIGSGSSTPLSAVESNAR
jgi:MFS family permease